MTWRQRLRLRYSDPNTWFGSAVTTSVFALVYGVTALFDDEGRNRLTGLFVVYVLLTVPIWANAVRLRSRQRRKR